MESGLAAVVDKGFSQQLRKEVERLQIRDSARRLAPVSDSQIAIPLLNSGSLKCYKNGDFYNIEGIQFSLQTILLPMAKAASVHNPYRKLCDSMKDLMSRNNICWTSELAKDIPHRWEQHGDMILLPGGSFSRQEWQHVASVVYKKVCEVFGVKRLAKKSVISDDKYRSSQVTLLIGEDGWVKHVDNGIIYTYDVTQCMFSVGNITEKLRIASLDCTGETVVDMFAGIGYFTLPYLVHAHASKVYACEWNPHAVEALKRNLMLNKVDTRCEVLEGDNQVVCPKGVADRVNLGLIPSSESSWPAACSTLKSTGGILHIHGNVTDNNKQDSADGHMKLVENTECELDKQRRIEHESCHISNCGFSSDVSDMHTLCFTPAEHVSDEQNIPDTVQPSALLDQFERGDFGLKLGMKVRHNLVWLKWAKNVCSQIEQILFQQQNKQWICTVLHVEHVKSYAPHINHLVVDLQCRPSRKS